MRRKMNLMDNGFKFVSDGLGLLAKASKVVDGWLIGWISDEYERRVVRWKEREQHKTL